MAYENLKSTGIKYLLQKLKTVFLQIKDAVKSVNGNLPDANGDITLSSIPYADNLRSESSFRDLTNFSQRTSGGTLSVKNGDAWLMNIKGYSTHEGYVPEVLNVVPTLVGSDGHLEVTVDRDDFVSEHDSDLTATIAYADGAWSTDPDDYSLTITGTPVAGDYITITYVKEVRGTITVSNPQSFVSTGWNLYKHSVGYARVVAYEEGYRISGAYTALKYSSTIDGTKTTLEVNDVYFDVPGDGYVWVTGGDSTSTAIYPMWTDWGDGYSGSFEAYSESVIDLSSVMSSNFPYGLLKAGSVVDEIDLNLATAYSRVQRLAYSAANRATAESSGREYEFDEDYIYLAKASNNIGTYTNLNLSGSYTVNDHGIEYFTGDTGEVTTDILYGNNLKNKLEHDVLTKSDLVNSLTSTSTTRPLTAKQGKTLNDSVKTKVGYLNLSTRTLAAKVEGAQTKTYTLTANSVCLIYLNGSSGSVSFSVNDIQLLAANGFRESVVLSLASGSTVKLVGASGSYAEVNILS